MLLAVVLCAAVPIRAQAATQQFAGVLEDGRLVTFTSQSTFALTTPLRIVGLRPNEQLVALDRGADGVLYGLGSSATLYSIDLPTGRAVNAMGGRTIAQGLRGRRFSLIVGAEGDRARILSDVGQDVIVEVRPGGADADGPGLRTQDGTMVQPAADAQPDGRVVGVDLARGALVRETAPASGVVATTPLAIDRRRLPTGISEPTAFSLGADGRGWLLAVLTDQQRNRQSQLLSVDTATGAARPLQSTVTRRLGAFSALGLVPDDTQDPRLRIRVPRTLSVRRLAADLPLPVTVRTDEAAQIVYSMRIGRRQVGFSFVSRDTPGTLRRISLFVNRGDQRLLRRSVGRRAQLIITSNDFKGNGRSVVRQVRLTR
jgi:hypothetical protein